MLRRGWHRPAGRRAPVSRSASAAVLAAYEADPALAVMRTGFTATVREVVEVLIAGLLARSSR
jgi:hypothetical protein